MLRHPLVRLVGIGSLDSFEDFPVLRTALDRGARHQADSFPGGSKVAMGLALERNEKEIAAVVADDLFECEVDGVGQMGLPRLAVGILQTLAQVLDKIWIAQSYRRLDDGAVKGSASFRRQAEPIATLLAVEGVCLKKREALNLVDEGSRALANRDDLMSGKVAQTLANSPSTDTERLCQLALGRQPVSSLQAPRGNQILNSTRNFLGEPGPWDRLHATR
jgi:hypothetical protein